MPEFYVEDRKNGYLAIGSSGGLGGEIVALYCPTGEGLQIPRSEAFDPQEPVLLIKKKKGLTGEKESRWRRECRNILEYYRMLVVEGERYVQVQFANDETMGRAFGVATEKALGLPVGNPVVRGPPKGVPCDERKDDNDTGKDFGFDEDQNRREKQRY